MAPITRPTRVISFVSTIPGGSSGRGPAASPPQGDNVREFHDIALGDLVAEAATVTSKTVVCADYAVARNYYPNRVPPNRATNRTRRDLCAAMLF